MDPVLQVQSCERRLDVYPVLDAIIARAIFTDPACYQGAPSERKRAIMQYLGIARGVHLPLTQMEARLAHPREGRLRNLAAFGDLMLLKLKARDLSTARDLLTQGIQDDPESFNRATMAGHVHVLDWLLAWEISKWSTRAMAAKEALLREDPEASETRQGFAMHRVDFLFPAPSNHALFEAIRAGHVAALEWWESKRGTCPLAHVFDRSRFRLDFRWPHKMLSIAVDAGRQDVVQWIATRLPFHPPIADAFTIAAERNDIAMLNLLMDTVVSVTAAPATPDQGAWLEKMVTPSMLLVAAHQGNIDALEWMYSIGVVNYLVQHPVHGPGLVGDMLKPSQCGFDQVLSWWLGVSIEYGIRLLWDHRCLLDPSINGHVHVLDWWLAHRDILPIVCDRCFVDAVTDALGTIGGSVRTVLSALNWWLQAALANNVPFMYSASAVDSASAFGSVDVLDWWWRAQVCHGISLRYSERAIEGACQNGHVQVLEWWLSLLQHHQQPFRYSALAITLASAYGRMDVLEWFLHRGIPIKFNPRITLTPAPKLVSSEGVLLAVSQFWQQHPECVDPSLAKGTTFQLQLADYGADTGVDLNDLRVSEVERHGWKVPISAQVQPLV